MMPDPHLTNVANNTDEVSKKRCLREQNKRDQEGRDYQANKLAACRATDKQE